MIKVRWRKWGGGGLVKDDSIIYPDHFLYQQAPMNRHVPYAKPAKYSAPANRREDLLRHFTGRTYCYSPEIDLPLTKVWQNINCV
jgi:hypothetical protein